MKYRVKATPQSQKLAAFYEILTDGTVEQQKPDGAEIVASMKRAKLTGPDTIEWYETCYCSTPLQHERETVYYQYLTNIETQLVDEVEEIPGDSFWETMKQTAECVGEDAT